MFKFWVNLLLVGSCIGMEQIDSPSHYSWLQDTDFTDEAPREVEDAFLLTTLFENTHVAPRAQHPTNNNQDNKPLELVWELPVAIAAIECIYCSDRFMYKKDLANHYALIHREAKPYACHYADCNKVYNLERTLTQHIRIKHEFKNYYSKFRSKKNKSTKNFSCECTKKFKSERELKLHISRMHDPVHDQICPDCSHSYSTKESLLVHILRKHRPADLECKYCDEKFALQGDLNQHYSRIHPKKNPQW